MANFTKDELLVLARQRQQNFYELMPDWIIYQSEDVKYLKQNISFAMYGIEIFENDGTTTNAGDITDKIKCRDDIMKTVDMLFEKICEYSKMSNECIACGAIYNIIFNYEEINAESKSGNKAQSEVEDDTQKLYPVPIFKIIRCKDSKETMKYSTTIVNDVQFLPPHDTWFMDTSGRIYKSWHDYMNNNTLPKCTMVVPKSGFYQAHPAFEITETCSIVWIEIAQSPACKVSKKLLKYADIGSTVIGIGGAVTLGAAAFLTPLGPIAAMAGLATTGVTGLWTAGRCSHELIDRSTHEESLNDREAMKSWLGIAGSALGMAAGGGAIAIARSAQKGMVVGKVWQAAYNTALVGDIAVNVVGIGHQGYCLYQKHQEDGITTIDVLTFTAHVLFFGSTVISCKFAKSIIESTQGNILRDYEATLRSKRHRKSYNRVKRNAAANSSCKIAENAEIISYIKKVNRPVDLIPGYQMSSSKVVLKFEGGFLKVNDIKLIDPVFFVQRLIKEGVFRWDDDDNESLNKAIANDQRNNSGPNFLCKLLEELLSTFYLSDMCPKTEKLPIVSDFEPIINQIMCADNPTEVLTIVFNVAVKVLKKYNKPSDLLVEACQFVWEYIKYNLKEGGMKLCSYVENSVLRKILQKVVHAICIALDIVVQNLITAFGTLQKFCK